MRLKGWSLQTSASNMSLLVKGDRVSRKSSNNSMSDIMPKWWTRCSQRWVRTWRKSSRRILNLRSSDRSTSRRRVSRSTTGAKLRQRRPCTTRWYPILARSASSCYYRLTTNLLSCFRADTLFAENVSKSMPAKKRVVRSAGPDLTQWHQISHFRI